MQLKFTGENKNRFQWFKVEYDYIFKPDHYDSGQCIINYIIYDSPTFANWGPESPFHMQNVALPNSLTHILQSLSFGHSLKSTLHLIKLISGSYKKIRAFFTMPQNSHYNGFIVLPKLITSNQSLVGPRSYGWLYKSLTTLFMVALFSWSFEPDGTWPGETPDPIS